MDLLDIQEADIIAGDDLARKTSSEDTVRVVLVPALLMNARPFSRFVLKLHVHRPNGNDALVEFKTSKATPAESRHIERPIEPIYEEAEEARSTKPVIRRKASASVCKGRPDSEETPILGRVSSESSRTYVSDELPTIPAVQPSQITQKASAMPELPFVGTNFARDDRGNTSAQYRNPFLYSAIPDSLWLPRHPACAQFVSFGKLTDSKSTEESLT